MPFNPNAAPNNAEGRESTPQTPDSMDLDFTATTEVSPAEVADQKESAEKAAAIKASLDSYDWDNPNQRRAGYK